MRLRLSADLLEEAAVEAAVEGEFGVERGSEEASHLVAEIAQIYRNYEYKTEIIVAAARNARQIVEAAVAGADIVTSSLDVYKDAFDHPYTAKGLKLFADNWDATPYQ